MIPLILALLIGVMPASEAQPLPGDQYADTWVWCADRFPGQAELQEACRWGAFDMIYQTPAPTEWSA